MPTTPFARNFMLGLRLTLSFLLAIFIHNNIAIAKPILKKNDAPKMASLLVDLDTGKILHANNHNVRIYPASLTKLMTIYIVFDNIKRNKLKFHNKFIVSENATKMPPSKLHLKEGDTISVHDAVVALIVKSANDVAVTVAENIAGSEERFAKIMNNKARSLRMNNTSFQNASGWHAKNQYTTAVDLMKLTRALQRDFPEYYPLFKKTDFVHNGTVIKGHNKVSQYYPGAEGLKTGYTAASGFNLITVAKNGDKRFAGIVIGHKKADSRDKKMVELLNQVFKINFALGKPKVDSNVQLAKNSTNNLDDPIDKYINASAKKAKKKDIPFQTIASKGISRVKKVLRSEGVMKLASAISKPGKNKSSVKLASGAKKFPRAKVVKKRAI